MQEVMVFLEQYLTVANVLKCIYIINFIIAFEIIFFEKKAAAASLAWILVLFVLPVVGLVFYIVFSQNIARHKIFKLTDIEEESQDFLLSYQIDEMNRNEQYYPNKITKTWSHLIRLNQKYGKSFLTNNNDIELLTDGKMMFHKLMKDIRGAEKKINIQYFIIKNDMVGNKLLDLLTKKAEEGVEVRLMMDALGSKQITTYKLRKFKSAGGKYAFFFKPRIRHLYVRFNYRNHRKMVVIDDKIGYIGGFNIANEYLGFKKKFGYWRDTHLRLTGDAIIALNQRFYLDWRCATKEKIGLIDELTTNTISKVTTGEGNMPVQIVSSGPESPKEEIKQGMMKMITFAKRSIYLQTPYLVPDRSMIDSLVMAAQSDIDVRIMIPCMPDHPFVYRKTLANAGELIDAGAKIYIYQKGFLHAKTLLVDGEVSTVGSANFDIRSFRLNFESNAFVYDEKFAEEMEDRFRQDIQFSKEYTAEDRKNISVWEKILEAISELLTEIL